jgi:LuxR family transcriptional regulator, maltose regulon positive regulatory protein
VTCRSRRTKPGCSLAQFGVQLDDRDLSLVQRRSEGWAAGLQNAAICIHQSDEPTDAAQRVDLKEHTVAGYFLDEVLNRQPPEVVDFMLVTSVLDELSVPMCTALCGEAPGGLHDLLYREHMFVTMVDQEERTYRYHQLIAEVLQAELHARHPGRAKLLHATAARHLADAGELGPAVRHLLAAGDPEGAFRLLNERVIQSYFTNPTVGSALDLDEVQPSAFTGVPEVLVPLATELLVRGAFAPGSLALELAQQTGVDPAS